MSAIDLAEPPSRVSHDAAPLFVVVNVGSGSGAAAELREAIEDGVRRAGRRAHVIEVTDPKALQPIARRTVERARAEGGIVVAAGGDGTINTIAQAVLGSGCAFGVLPQGTFNYFSRTHGIPPDPRQAMQVLLSESPRPVQVGLVNERLFLVNASLGLYPKLIEDREAFKRQWGRSRWVAIGAGIMTLLRGHRSLRVRIDVDGVPREVRTPTLFVGNNALQLEQLGLPEAKAVDAGRLAAIMLRPAGRLALLGVLLRGALGQLGEADRLTSFGFSTLTVRSPRALRWRRIKVAIDGEIAWLKLPLTFSVSPVPLDLVCPAEPAPERLDR